MGTEIKNLILSNTVDNHQGCWIWLGRVQSSGYGVARINKKEVALHRASYIAFNGVIPEGLLVRHRCHTRRCCNPLHLDIGTPKDNWVDMLVDGNSKLLRDCGSDNLKSKLSEDDVYSIRLEFKTGSISSTELGKKYKVGRKCVERTVNGEAYSCYQKVPPYDWRDLECLSFHKKITRKGRKVVQDLYAEGCTIAQISRETGLTQKIVRNAIYREYTYL